MQPNFHIVYHLLAFVGIVLVPMSCGWSQDTDPTSKQGTTSNPMENISGQEDVFRAMTLTSQAFRAAADKIRKEIEKNCDYVGDKFADEARSIHYGEKPERAIYGEASPAEAAELKDEGVGIAPLPEILTPKPKSKQN